jgi:hypothetical protein
VKKVWASPEQGRVVVQGKADAYALRRRIERKMDWPVEIVSDGSAPYYDRSSTAAPHYGPSQLPEYGYYSQPPPSPYAYYSHRPHAYYAQPPPDRSYHYAAGGYGGDGWSDPDPYGYAAHRTVSSWCSIM